MKKATLFKVSVVVVAVAAALLTLIAEQNYGTRAMKAGSPAASPWKEPFDPDVSPFLGEGREVTLAEAKARMAETNHPIYTPDVPGLATDDSITHVWLDEYAPDPPPPGPTAAVAISYTSGVQVTFEPVSYGSEAYPKTPSGILDSVTENVEAVTEEWGCPENYQGFEVSVFGGRTIETVEQDACGIPGPTVAMLGVGEAWASSVSVSVLMWDATVDQLHGVATSIVTGFNQAHPQAVPHAPYAFTGFLPPVSNPPEQNVAQAGRAIPIRFGLGGDQGLEIFSAGYPLSVRVDCAAPVLDIPDLGALGPPTPMEKPGNSSLGYDPGNDTYNIVWKTDKAWAGTCRQFVLGLNDWGSAHVATFKFKS